MILPFDLCGIRFVPLNGDWQPHGLNVYFNQIFDCVVCGRVAGKKFS